MKHMTRAQEARCTLCWRYLSYSPPIPDLSFPGCVQKNDHFYLIYLAISYGGRSWLAEATEATLLCCNHGRIMAGRPQERR